MAATEAHMDAKLLVDNKKNKVLYAEVGRDFVDVLFSFLTLALGTVVRLIGKTQLEPLKQLGCFGALYQSVKSLGNEHFSSDVFKDMLLQPRSLSEDHCRWLKINLDDTDAKVFTCPSECAYSGCHKFTSIYKNTSCPNCEASSMSTVKTLRASTGCSKVFVTNASKFFITDDLQVTPVHPGIAILLLNNLDINDTSVIGERTVKLGLNECLQLLNYSFLSTTPLTDLFIFKKTTAPSSVLQNPSLQAKRCIDKSLEDRKIDVKAVLKKDTKEFLFVEAHQDFIDFLFSLLAVPLGGMLRIMDGRSCAGSVDGLYKGALSLNSRYFVSKNHKNMLVRPKLAPNFDRQNRLFPLETAPFSCTIDGMFRIMPVNSRLRGIEGSGGFLGDEAVFIVEDNLKVIPFCTTSAISILRRNNVSISGGVEERTLSIGVAEGINIVRAALNSSYAISNGLGLERAKARKGVMFKHNDL